MHSAAARSKGASGYFAQPLADSPWRRRDLTVLAVLHALALVGIVVCWFGSSGSVDFRDQTAWTALAALCAAVAASSGAAWLLRGLATISSTRRALREQIAALYGGVAHSDRDGAPAADGFVTTDGMRRYHRPSCDVVRGKATRPAAAPGNEDLLPCGMCRS